MFTNINKYKLLKYCYTSKTGTVFYSSAKRKSILRNPISSELLSLLDKHSPLYSSYFENNKLHVGYQKHYVFDNILKKQTEYNNRNKIGVKPFSIALKYIDENAYNSTVVAKNDEIKVTDDVLRKYVNEETTVKPVGPWMNDYESYNQESDNESTFGTAGINTEFNFFFYL